ncbi:MAG: LCP family protein [Anaerolineae bacterium]|jgi:LCP family protein required for cell wall assembly|nr:LCP family protein [Anaerolineae bacterium]
MKNTTRFTLLLIIISMITWTQAQEATPAPRWTEERRFSVLIAGLDRRPAQQGLNVRTDAIMVMSFEPVTESIGILHIPRDLFLALPSQYGPPNTLIRANTLLLRGESFQEGLGPYYVMDTIQFNLGIYLDAYILFDFEAFTTIVDAIGGVEIETLYDIADPAYPSMTYGYDPFYLRAGRHLLDGETALKFARTRHGDNDYVRGARQLQLFRAIGERVTSPDVLPQLLTQGPRLLSDLDGHLYTDLTLIDAIPLISFAARVPLDQIQTGAINQEFIDYAVVEGDSVAIPDRTRLSELMLEVFGPGYDG